MTEGLQEADTGAGDAGQSEPKSQSEGMARYRLHSGSAIVPRESVPGQALSVVIAIMAFLACMTVGAVSIVAETSANWQSDIAREVTIQIRPFDEEGMDEAVRKASRLVVQFDGIAKVTALDAKASAALLEPWLGSGLDLAELPVPRLLTVTVKEGANPDFEAMAEQLRTEVPAASLDDHRLWVDRLATMAFTLVAIGIGVLMLVLLATVLSVVFATKGAMAGNREIIDVLHFVGADARFIAREFQRHFLALALRGAIAGGAAAMMLFVVLALWSVWNASRPQADQIGALFGNFMISAAGYVGIVLVIATVSLLASGTSRFIVMRQIDGLEAYRRN